MKTRVVLGSVAVLVLALVGCGPQPTTGEMPVAVIVYTPTRGENPLYVTFSATHSAASNGTIVAYAWEFGDGTSASGVTASHWYREEGTFLAKLTVTDSRGLSGSTQVPLIVGQSYPLDVIEWVVEEVYFGTKVSGRVRNIGDRKINQGRVVVRFYDRDWQVIRERSKIVADLAPGAEQIFEITTDLRIAEFGGAPHHSIYTEVIHSDHPLSPLGER